MKMMGEMGEEELEKEKRWRRRSKKERNEEE
jgi:hypothetical protein